MRIKKFLTEHAVDILVALAMLAAIVPALYLGGDAYFTVHDHLDSIPARYKMLKDNGLLFALDAPTNAFGGMSTAFLYTTYSVHFLAYYIFDILHATLFLYVLKIVVGYFSMFLLLRRLFPEKENSGVLKLVSVGFALLPSLPQWYLFFETIPLLCFAFLVMIDWKEKKPDKRVFWLLLYPACSSFIAIGFAVLAIWLLGAVIWWIYTKKLNINHAMGFLCLTVGYIMVDLKIFYVKFILREPLNRTIFPTGGLSVSEIIGSAGMHYLSSDTVYFAPHLAAKVVFPVLFMFLAFMIPFLLYKLAMDENRKEYRRLAKYTLLLVALFAVTVIFTLANTFYGVGFVKRLINAFIPFLNGFDWGRAIYLNRIVFPICFAGVLVALLSFRQYKWMRYLTCLLACMQILVIYTFPGRYSYAYFNLNHNRMQSEGMVTFNEFYAVDFFENIKEELDYDGEGVAAVGYQSSALMYNGFSCVDGYVSSYPLAWHHAFRRIIEPTLEKSPRLKTYYDSWGGRMELFNTQVDFTTIRTKSAPVELHINTEAFRDVGGVYILSRAEISNAKELNLTFVKAFSSASSIYEIFVYKAV